MECDLGTADNCVMIDGYYNKVGALVLFKGRESTEKGMRLNVSLHYHAQSSLPPHTFAPLSTAHYIAWQ